MDLEHLGERVLDIIKEALDDEDWDDLMADIFVSLARKAADATETEFDDKAVEYIIDKLGLDD